MKGSAGDGEDGAGGGAFVAVNGREAASGRGVVSGQGRKSGLLVWASPPSRPPLPPACGEERHGCSVYKVNFLLSCANLPQTLPPSPICLTLVNGTASHAFCSSHL